ncbi:hypothetical protein LINPERHAP1_LOCUS14631 [Linum perenne]
MAGFLWQVYHRNISTFDNLTKRGFVGPNFCVLCRADLESVSHLFLGCRFSYSVWTTFSSKLAMVGPIDFDVHGFILGWQFRNCVGGLEIFRTCLLHAVFWYIWGERNSRIFRDEVSTIPILVWKIALAVGRWLRVAGKISDLAFRN